MPLNYLTSGPTKSHSVLKPPSQGLPTHYYLVQTSSLNVSFQTRTPEVSRNFLLWDAIMILHRHRRMWILLESLEHGLLTVYSTHTHATTPTLTTQPLCAVAVGFPYPS